MLLLQFGGNTDGTYSELFLYLSICSLFCGVNFIDDTTCLTTITTICRLFGLAYKIEGKSLLSDQLKKNLLVLRIRIRDLVLFWPLDTGWIISGRGSRDGWVKNTSHSLLRIRIRDLGPVPFWFWIRVPGWKTRVREKHPESAAQLKIFLSCGEFFREKSSLHLKHVAKQGNNWPANFSWIFLGKVVFVLLRMSRSEAIVDRIFAGNLDDLPPLSSKVSISTNQARLRRPT
jgi:hypothetical protein